MKRWFLGISILIIVSLLLSGCLEKQNKLEEIAKLSPAKTHSIVYINLKKLLENEYIVKYITESLDLPPQVTYLRFIVDDGGMLVLDGYPIFIVKGTGLDILATLLPSLKGIGNLVGLKLEINAKKMGGETVYVLNNNVHLTYWVYKGRVFISEYPAMEKFINARKSGQTAINNFKKIISKLKNNDVMGVEKKGYEGIEGIFVKSIGFSVSLEGKKSNVVVIIETLSPESAELLTKLPTDLPTGITLKKISTDGELVLCEFEVEIKKLGGIEKILLTGIQPKRTAKIPSKKPKFNTTMVENLPCDNMESCLTYCDEHQEECNKILSELGLPCETVDECKFYCLMNPEECQSLLENFSKYMSSQFMHKDRYPNK